MKKTILTILIMALLLTACPADAAPMGTAFTYQGRLIDDNIAADGLYDFQFTLYDCETEVPLGNSVYIDNNDVNDGYFTVKLDFGSDVFNGDSRCLEIGVRPGEHEDPNEYTILSPWQEVTATPYAIYAGSGKWENLIGIPDDIADGDDIGITSETDPTVLASVKDGVSWSEVSDRPAGLDDGDDVGITSETDPQVGTNTTNYVPKWDGSALVSGTIYDNGNVGIGTTSPEENLHVVGNLKIVDGNQGNGKVLTSNDDGVASWQNLQGLPGGVPSGVIAMWSGSINNIPPGWALCDGTNCTPDLRDRFIVGAGNIYDVNDTGGSTQHNHGGNTANHTLTIAEMPSHSHNSRYNAWGSGERGDSEDTAYWKVTSVSTSSTGGNQPHSHGISYSNHLPPYYALAYIMKL
jgi:microcystin-dependent protein